MKKILSLIGVAVLVLSAFSCKKSSYEIPDRYKEVESLAIKGSAAVEFTAEGGDYFLSVVDNSEDLTVKTSSDWLNVTASGQEVTFSCGDNLTLLSRYATVTISTPSKSCTVQVKQFGVSKAYLWDEEYAFEGNGGSVALKYLETPYTIKLKVEGQEWISASVANNTLTITVAKNDTGAERTGQVTWQADTDIRTIVIAQAKGNGGGGSGKVIYSEDFENEDTLEDWRFIDLDQDSYNWMYSGQLSAHSGVGLLFSQSYINDLGPLEPDNWAFTPEISFTSNNYLSFWVTAQDQTYPDEHYAVYVTDALPQSQADLDAMTKLHEATYPNGDPAQEETLGGDKPHVWQRFVIQIPESFAGKTGYVVFRHFDCTDCYYLNLDDVMVTEGVPSATSTAVAPASINRTVSVDLERK